MHIDGHSDEALLQLMDQMAFFDWPSSDEQVQVLMQRNDVFITVGYRQGQTSLQRLNDFMHSALGYCLPNTLCRVYYIYDPKFVLAADCNDK